MFIIFSYICLFVVANFYNRNMGLWHNTCWERDEFINPFVPYAPFLYPLKASENRKERVHCIIRSGRKQPSVFYNKITCFEEHLPKAASIRCYFDTISVRQSDFCTSYSFTVLVLKWKYENHLNSWTSKIEVNK